jgi:transposase
VELLRQLGIEISANTVARLLHEMDFSLRVNRKAIATDSSPDRDQQFPRGTPENRPTKLRQD